MMNTFEIILCCLVIPIAYVLFYIAGKYDVLAIVCDMLSEKTKCEHDWHIVEKSNAIQLDSMGYPLRLFIRKCSKCGASDQQWLDVPVAEANDLKNGESFLLTWKKLT
jgi:hypothetical protein